MKWTFITLFTLVAALLLAQIPQASVSVGLQRNPKESDEWQSNIPSPRITAQYYQSSFILAAEYIYYPDLIFYFSPYKENATLSQEEFSVRIEKALFSPAPLCHLSLGTGIVYRVRTQRDEYISYETWTEKEKHDVGLPVVVNLETFFKKSHIVFNLGYKGIVFEDQFKQYVGIDLGLWFGR